MLEFDTYERDLWSGRGTAYRDSFGSLCAGAADALLDGAGVSAGTRLLDVGTGPGTVARRAIARGADVSAVDAEPSMVALASEYVPDVRLGLLPDLPFEDGTFDVAVANFVINHVGDPVAALRGIRRVVRPGGVVAVTIWPFPTPVPQGLAGDAIAAAGVEPVGVVRLAAEHEFVRDVDGFAALLSAAGLREVTSTELRWDHRTDPEVWWSGPARGIGSSGYVLLQQSPETIQRVKHEYDRLAASYLGEDGMLTLPAVALLATGRG